MANFSDVGNDPRNVPANELVKALKGIDFPAGKDKMKARARENNAPDTIVRALDELPGREFNSPVEVEKAYSDLQKK